MFSKKKELVGDQTKRIADLLFPDYQEVTDGEGNKWVIDRSITSNLETVMIDLSEGRCDEICIETLTEIYRKLSEVEKILKIDRKIISTGNVNYMVSP